MKQSRRHYYITVDKDGSQLLSKAEVVAQRNHLKKLFKRPVYTRIIQSSGKTYYVNVNKDGHQVESKAWMLAHFPLLDELKQSVRPKHHRIVATGD